MQHDDGIKKFAMQIFDLIQTEKKKNKNRLDEEPGRCNLSSRARKRARALT